MRSLTTPRFWRLYYALSEEMQRRAGRAYYLWRLNPQAQSLYFKRVNERQPIYSVRNSKGYRAVGMLEGESILWFWIGEHDEYIRLLKHL